MNTKFNDQFKAAAAAYEAMTPKEDDDFAIWDVCERVAFKIDRDDIADIIVILNDAADAMEALSRTEAFKAADSWVLMDLLRTCLLVRKRVENEMASAKEKPHD